MKRLDIKSNLNSSSPYSPAILVNGTLYLSGQIGIDDDNKEMAVGNIERQVEIIFNNIKTILSNAGLTLDNIVKTTIFLDNMDNFAKVNELYALYFDKPYPARSTIEVSKLPLNADVEIELIAVNDTV